MCTKIFEKYFRGGGEGPDHMRQDPPPPATRHPPHRPTNLSQPSDKTSDYIAMVKATMVREQCSNGEWFEGALKRGDAVRVRLDFEYPIDAGRG